MEECWKRKTTGLLSIRMFVIIQGLSCVLNIFNINIVLFGNSLTLFTISAFQVIQVRLFRPQFSVSEKFMP